MLTSNLWADARLVNEALGFVEKIMYNLRCSPPKPPTYVLVRFDNYIGISWYEVSHKIVPIIPIERGTTKQIPMKLTWGLTIHKSHGLTLEKETITIGNKKGHGLTFTTISQVKGLDGL